VIPAANSHWEDRFRDQARRAPEGALLMDNQRADYIGLMTTTRKGSSPSL